MGDAVTEGVASASDNEQGKQQEAERSGSEESAPPGTFWVAVWHVKEAGASQVSAGTLVVAFQTPNIEIPCAAASGAALQTFNACGAAWRDEGTP